MKRCLGLLALLCVIGQFVHAQSPASLDLKKRLENKTLYLRGFPTDLKVTYDSKGNPTKPFELGAWSYGQIFVEQVEFVPSRLTIIGKRVGQAYNGGWKEKKTTEEQVLVIEADPATLSSDQATQVYEAIFIAEKDVTKTAVNEWIRRDATGAPLLSPTDKTLRVGGPVKPPRAIETPKSASTEPKPREGAPRFEGTVVLRAVISERGEVLAVKLQKPLGMGLDEKAIRAVSAWTFEPARRDGKPVPVEIAVEVNFSLQ